MLSFPILFFLFGLPGVEVCQVRKAEWKGQARAFYHPQLSCKSGNSQTTWPPLNSAMPALASSTSKKTAPKSNSSTTALGDRPPKIPHNKQQSNLYKEFVANLLRESLPAGKNRAVFFYQTPPSILSPSANLLRC